MNPTTRIREAERLLRQAGATVVRRNDAHVIWTLNGYRTITSRHVNRHSRSRTMLLQVQTFIRRARRAS